MPFQILCLSGGGFLGLYTASVLAALERKYGRPIAQSFDLIAGTSVGGIIALGLAAEKSAEEIKNSFEKNGTHIFSDRPAPTTVLDELRDVIRYLWNPKYNGVQLRRTIVEIVGEQTRIGDLKHCVMIPAVNVTKGKPQIFKTAHHPTLGTDFKHKVVDVALATSAAPTFFPLAEIADSLFVDGGLYGNSPDLMALHEAEHFFDVSSSDVRILSIGTTTAQFSFSHAEGRYYGLFKWAMGQRLARAAISSQQSIVDSMVKHKLADRYLRIDALRSKNQERDIGLDIATIDAQRTIRGLAEASAQELTNNKTLNAILEHKAPPPHFFHSL